MLGLHLLEEELAQRVERRRHVRERQAQLALRLREEVEGGPEVAQVVGGVAERRNADTARARDTLQGLLDSFPEAKTGFSLACYFYLLAMLSPIRAKLPKAAQLRFSTNA